MWRVFWVPQDAVRTGVRRRVMAGWDDLRQRGRGRRASGTRSSCPDYRVDPLLGLYVQCAAFRKYTAETKRNYATDIGLLLTFLWGRDNAWIDAVERDLGDYEHWRRLAPGNPDRISGTKWDRELAAFASLYGWAAKNRDTGCTHNGTATGDSAMTPGALAPAAVPWPSRRRTAPMETRS